MAGKHNRTQPPSGKGWFTKLSAIVGAAAMSLMGIAGTGISANAAEAQGGASSRVISDEDSIGRYKESIDWLEWANQPDQTISDAKTVWSTPHSAGSNQWVATQCVVTPTGGPALETYKTGEFYGDAFLKMYGVGNDNVVGVANETDAETSVFNYECNEYLIKDSATAPTLSAETSTEGMQSLPLQGLVFADAESNNYNWSQQESIGVKPISSNGGTPTWRLLDSYRTAGCQTSSLASLDQSGNMLFRSDGDQCANSDGQGPASAMFLQNSQGAEVSVKGGGRTAVALGVMPAFDFGDAPDSYGVASSQFGPDWNGGALGTDIAADGSGMYNLSEARENGADAGSNISNDSGLLATMQQPTPRLGATEDSETGNAGGATGADTDQWAKGDDTSGASQPAPGDEDGVTMSEDGNGFDVVKVQPDMTNHTYSQPVSCSGTGNVRGWIDWNRDGAFDTKDASDTVPCSGGSATLNWTNIPDNAVRSVASDEHGQPTFMRVRISGDTEDLQPTGFTASGEVEDYQVALMIPTLSVVMNLPSAKHQTGRINDSDQFDAYINDADGSQLTHQATSGTTGGQQTDTAINNYAVTAGSTYEVGSKLTDASATSDENDYTSSITCQDISKQTPQDVAVEDGRLAIPSDDANVQCTVSRTPWDEEPHAKLTLNTVVHNDEGYAPNPANAATFERYATPNGGAQTSYANGVMSVVDPGTYTISGSDKSGYAHSETYLTCSTDGQDAQPVTGDVTLESGHSYECTLNYDVQPGSVTWQKVDKASNNPLSGSEWKLTDPENDTKTVKDCVADNATDCPIADLDTDPAAGSFKVEKLKWGNNYQVAENKAPLDHVLATDPISFDITADALTPDLGQIANAHDSGTLTINTTVLDGNATATEFTPNLTDSNNENVNYTVGQAKTVDTGKYTISAGTMADGYKLADSQSIHCVSDTNTEGWDLDPSGSNQNTVSMQASGNVTCTVPYETIKPTLTVNTVVNNTHGGTATPEDFTQTVTDSNGESKNYRSGQRENTTAGVSYKVTGTEKTGYSEPEIAYALQNADDSTTAITPDEAGVAAVAGQNVVATVTYNDQPAKVTVTSVFDDGTNPDSVGATRTVTDSNGATTDYANGHAEDNLNAGGYSADGSDVPGYIKTVTYKLDGEDVPANDVVEGKVSVGIGQHLEATVNYTKAGKLTVNTVVNGGDANADELDRTVTYPDTSTHTFTNGESQDVAPGSYKVKGADAPAGYSDPTYEYALDDDTKLTADEAGVAIGAGQDVTATIVYNVKSQLAVNVAGDYKFGGTDAGSGSKVTVSDGGEDVSVPANAAQPTTVDSGTYSVAQLLNSGYKMKDITVTDVATGQPITVAEDGAFKVEPGQNVRVDIENEDVPGTLEWSRFDKDGKTLLNGSKWQLSGPDGAKLDVEDCTALACTGLNQDPTPGKFRVTNLKWGDWTITETQAPAGHELSKPLTLALHPDANDPNNGLLRAGNFQDGKSAEHPQPGDPNQPNGQKPLSSTGSAITPIVAVAVVLVVAAAGIMVAMRRSKNSK